MQDAKRLSPLLDEGEYHRDPTAFVSARLLLRNDLLKAIEEERTHASV
jgi:hypothetical protein